MASPLLTHEVTGDDRRLGLMLLHPLGASLRFWDDAIDHWRGTVSCVAPDLRQSTGGPAARPTTLEEQVDDLERLRASLGFERLVLVATAVSTMVAACYAGRFPDRVAGLVMTNATARSIPKAAAMLTERGHLVRAEGIAAILPQAVERSFLNLPFDERYEAYLAAFARQSAEDYAFACLACARFDATPYLPAITCPTLVIAGEHDVLLPPELGRDMASQIANAHFEIMPETAHFVPYQRPDAFARRVLDFLGDMIPRPAA